MNELRDENIEVESSLLGLIFEFNPAKESEQIASPVIKTVKLDLALCQSYWAHFRSDLVSLKAGFQTERGRWEPIKFDLINQ